MAIRPGGGDAYDAWAPQVADETLQPFDLRTVQPGDVVGIGIHTDNALRGYEIRTLARARGATVVFGGVHATLYPDIALDLGVAHAVVKGDGDVAWPLVLGDAARGTLRPLYEAIPKLYRQMYANTGIATDSACVSRANRWARLIARPCRRPFTAGRLSARQRPRSPALSGSSSGRR